MEREPSGNLCGEECFLALDLGGAWIKGSVAFLPSGRSPSSRLEAAQIRNPSSGCPSVVEFVETLFSFCRQLAGGATIRGVVASTAGAVDGPGKGYRVAAKHLGMMARSPWREQLEKQLGCECWLINDAEAYLLGIPSTFGEAPSRFVTVVAGGVADASLTIESNFEEDHSAVPDMILLQPQPEDIVLGIAASGTAYFVRSALRYSQSCGAYTVLVHEAGIKDAAFFDADLRLRSGEEFVPGSIRMKAGTATKKVLNMISTTAQILLGRVRGGRMIDLQCTNEKLRHRAEGILAELGGIGPEEARERLVRHDYRLREALEQI